MSGAKMNLDDILDQALEDFEKEFKKRNPVAEKKTTPSSSTMKTDIEPQIKQQTASLTSSQSQTSYKTTQNLLPENDCMNMKPSSSAATNKMMDDLLNQFDESENDKKGDEDDDDDEVIDGMMQQLLSKDLMCEPTRLLCERYPTWLSENKDKITEEQYLNYEKQYITFQRLLATYDTQPDNYTRYAFDLVCHFIMYLNTLLLTLTYYMYYLQNMSYFIFSQRCYTTILTLIYSFISLIIESWSSCMIFKSLISRLQRSSKT